MLGEPTNHCHMRVPVSSNTKDCQVSRFRKTDSRSRTRTRTWAGVAARSANETIGTTPPREPGAQFDRAGGNPLNSILPGIAEVRHVPDDGKKRRRRRVRE